MPGHSPLFYQLQESFVDARVVGQLGMERRDEDAPLPREHGMPVVLGEDLDLRACLLDPRRADEHAAERLLVARDVEVGLEAVHLPPPRVPLDFEVDETEVIPVEDDHPRARAEDRAGKSRSARSSP